MDNRDFPIEKLLIGGWTKREIAAFGLMLTLTERLSDEGVKFRDGKPSRTFSEWEGTMQGIASVAVMGADALFDRLASPKAKAEAAKE